MPYEEQPRSRFDEQKAAAELERLQQDLEESRRRRKDASAAFDAFVNSFHHKEPRSRTDRPPARPDSRPPAPKLDAPVGMAASGAAGASWQVPARRRAVPVPLVLGGMVAILTALVLTRAWRTSEDPAVSTQPSLATPASEPALPAAAPGSPTAAVAGAGGVLQAELVALRGVWVRATADGVRVVERELRPDERIPLRAARALVIRAGDAGAVRMSVNGQDRGVLGADGIVVTRTFNAPAGRPPAADATSR
jgi:hypothetical protein